MRGTLPLSVRRIVRKLGNDIRDTRLRRHIRQSTLASRRSNTRIPIEPSVPALAYRGVNRVGHTAA